MVRKKKASPLNVEQEQCKMSFCTAVLLTKLETSNFIWKVENKKEKSILYLQLLFSSLTFDFISDNLWKSKNQEHIFCCIKLVNVRDGMGKDNCAAAWYRRAVIRALKSTGEDRGWWFMGLQLGRVNYKRRKAGHEKEQYRKILKTRCVVCLKN